MELERLKFGKYPDTYNQGLVRLPRGDDPRIPDDEILLGLAHMRYILESTLNKPLPPLDFRFSKFSCEEVNSLEQNGFRRDKQIMFADWTTLLPDHPWADTFGITYRNSDEMYANWELFYMTPNFPDRRKFEFVCIKTNPYEMGYWETNNNSNFWLGLTTAKELKSLLEALKS